MIITFFKDEWTTYIDPELSMDLLWDEVAELLTTFVQTDTKEKTEMYNLWQFKITDDQIHRCADDCIALHGLVLDYDQNLSLVKAVDVFAGMECVIYTTFNHGISGLDKYRVVLPFTTPMPVEEFNKKRKSMIDTFKGADKASFSRSQAIFLHSGPNRKYAFAEHMRGSMLDWTAFEDEEVIPYVPRIASESDVSDEIKIAYRKAVIRSLMQCSGFRHLDSMSLVIVLKSCGANFAEYRAIAQACGAKDSCIQDPKTQQETWAAVPDDVKIGRAKRDEFITKFGGTPVVVKREDAATKKILEKYRK